MAEGQQLALVSADSEALNTRAGF